MKMTITPRKPGEIKVRREARRHKPNYDEIAALAYQLYEQDGRPDGKNWEHWFKAETLLRTNGTQAVRP